jgi:bifunctional pyridoxal-dependent enzyme with beta-cystathionase and maltose regulon repressor activities
MKIVFELEGKEIALKIRAIHCATNCCMNIQDLDVKILSEFLTFECLLNEEFQPNVEAILNAVDNNPKIIFLCSPNNPTGNSFDDSVVIKILNQFKGFKSDLYSLRYLSTKLFQKLFAFHHSNLVVYSIVNNLLRYNKAGR